MRLTSGLGNGTLTGEGKNGKKRKTKKQEGKSIFTPCML